MDFKNQSKKELIFTCERLEIMKNNLEEDNKKLRSFLRKKELDLLVYKTTEHANEMHLQYYKDEVKYYKEEAKYYKNQFENWETLIEENLIDALVNNVPENQHLKIIK